MNDKKMFGARIDPDLIKQVKHLSVDTEKTVAVLMEEALADLMLKYANQSPQRNHRRD